MRIRADLHTHSVASKDAYTGNHTSATREELAEAAAAKGIELIAVTDHGPACPGAAPLEAVAASALSPRRIAGVRVLAGIEADPIPSTENGLDVPDEILAALDFVTVALHPVTGWDHARGDVATITKALVRAIENPLVDMISHPGNAWFPVDIDTVVAAAVDNDVIVELNTHSFKPGSVREDSVTRERAFIAAAHTAGARLAVNSDAHHAADVGDVSLGLAVAEELGLAPDAFLNRDARSVLDFLLAKRPRPRLASEMRSEWEVE